MPQRQRLFTRSEQLGTVVNCFLSLCPRLRFIAMPIPSAHLAAPAPPTVTICVASFNTCSATELCIRSLRRFAGYPYSLRVGDSASTDGSLTVLETFERRGWLHLDRSAERRLHADWLDHWRRTCNSDLLLFVDSDIEVRRSGWLRHLVTLAVLERPAMIYAEWQPPQRYTLNGRPAQVLARPAPWVLMIDCQQTASLQSSFAETRSETVPPSPFIIVRDVGAAFSEEASQLGMRMLAMPPTYRRLYHHYGGLSWLPDRGRRGDKKLRDMRVIKRRLQRLRHVQDRSGALMRLLATVLLTPFAQEALDLIFRVKSRAKSIRDVITGQRTAPRHTPI